MARLVFGGILVATFVATKLLFNFGRRRYSVRNIEGSIRCPDCGTEVPLNYRCSSCGYSLQPELAVWKFVGILPFLVVTLLYLVLRRYVFPGTF